VERKTKEKRFFWEMVNTYKELSKSYSSEKRTNLDTIKTNTCLIMMKIAVV
jgi:hypothetical protein